MYMCIWDTRSSHGREKAEKKRTKSSEKKWKIKQSFIDLINAISHIHSWHQITLFRSHKLSQLITSHFDIRKCLIYSVNSSKKLKSLGVISVEYIHLFETKNSVMPSILNKAMNDIRRQRSCKRWLYFGFETL